MEQDAQGMAANADHKCAMDGDNENDADEINTSSRTNSDAN